MNMWLSDTGDRERPEMRDQKEEAARAPQETEQCTGGWKGSWKLGAGDITRGPNKYSGSLLQGLRERILDSSTGLLINCHLPPNHPALKHVSWGVCPQTHSLALMSQVTIKVHIRLNGKFGPIDWVRLAWSETSGQSARARTC